MNAPTRVLIADDEEVLRDALADVIRSDPGFELVGAAADAVEAVAMATELRPDVAVLDMKMPGGGGARATADIRRLAPSTRILGFSAYGDRNTVFELLRLGASGFLVKGSSPATLLEGIRKVHAGGSPLSPSVAGAIVGRLTEELEAERSVADRQKVLVSRVRGAIDGGLHMAYQPIVRLTDRAMIGYEALARFSIEPQADPAQWFADAAEAGLLVDLEMAAIRSAVCNSPGDGGTFISLNASPETVLAGGLDSVLAGVATVLEVTEHAPVTNYDELSAVLAPLKTRGVRLAIDDAGAGFASLRHILLLEPDLIKLDLSLTHDIDRDPRKRALAAALATFSREIGADTVAEGIETEAELATIRGLGIEYGQGYLFGKAEIPGAVEPALSRDCSQPLG